MSKNLPVLAFGMAAAMIFSACGSTIISTAIGNDDQKELLPQSVYSEAELRKASAFVSPKAHLKVYRRVGIPPFDAPTAHVRSLTTELFSLALAATGKYEIVQLARKGSRPSQEPPAGRGDDEISRAMSLGRERGVDAVLLGKVQEHSPVAAKGGTLLSLSLSAMMIDSSDGSVVWSASNSGTSPATVERSLFIEEVAGQAIERLTGEWRLAGDTLAVNLPTPKVYLYRGAIRKAIIEVLSDTNFIGFRMLRSVSRNGPFEEVASAGSTGKNSVLEDGSLGDSETFFYQTSGVTRHGLFGPPAGPFEITTAAPPGMVEGLTARSGLIREVPLSWGRPTGQQLKGYKISRREDGGEWQEIAVLSRPSDLTYTDKSLGDGVRYEYRVVCFNKGAVEGPAAEAGAMTKGPPSTPSGLAARSGRPRQVPLSWRSVTEPEVAGYIVFRAGNAEGPFEEIKRIKGQENTEYLDKEANASFWETSGSLDDEKAYFYRIRSFNVVDVESEDSAVVSAVTKAVPRPVEGLRADIEESSGVELQWRKNPESDITSYELYRGGDGVEEGKKIAEVQSPGTKHLDDKVKEGEAYFYRIRAVDGDGLPGVFSSAVGPVVIP